MSRRLHLYTGRNGPRAFKIVIRFFSRGTKHGDKHGHPEPSDMPNTEGPSTVIDFPFLVENDTYNILILDDQISTISRRRAESMRRRDLVGRIMQERLAQVQELQQEFLNAQKEYFDINSDIREDDKEIKRLQEGCVVGGETEQAVGVPLGAVTLPPNAIPALTAYLSKGRVATRNHQGRVLQDSDSATSDVSSTCEQAS